jgi:hypothetical protein
MQMFNRLDKAMKLTTEQHKIILRFLIREGLEYKEFIDEMHDHFIDSIEAKMSDGLNFAQALGETGGAFDDEIYRTWKLDFLPACGLRALEKKYLKAYSKGTKQEFYQLLKSDPFSIVNVLIMCVIVILGVAVYRGAISALGLIALSLLSQFVVVTYLLLKSEGKMLLYHGIIWLVSSKRERVRAINVDATHKTYRSTLYLIFLVPYLVFFVYSSAIYFPVISNAFTPTVNAYLSLGLLAVLLIYSAAMLQFIHRKNLIVK